MKIENIPINKIKVLQNIRSEVRKEDLGYLMRSIEHSGLQQPIGVFKKADDYILTFGFRRLEACKKLDWKEIPAVIISEEFTEEKFLIKNTIENIHRVDISPVELGKVCQLFIDNHGYTESEVAAKLNFSPLKIKTAYKLYRLIPKKYRSIIGYIPRGESNKGKIPAHVAQAVVQLHRSQEDMSKLLELAKTHELTTQQIFMIEKLSRTGFSIKDAFEHMNTCAVKNINIIVDKKEVEKLGYGKFSEYVNAVLTGEEKPNKKLIIR